MARVLLVDDDIAEISAVKRVLARGGHNPILATNARDALASVAEAPPDLLLVGATCESGDALRRLAEDDGARALPLLVIGENPAAPVQAAQVGRPVDPGQLIERVTALLAAAASAPMPAPAAAAQRETVARRAAVPALRRASPGASPSATRPPQPSTSATPPPRPSPSAPRPRDASPSAPRPRDASPSAPRPPDASPSAPRPPDASPSAPRPRHASPSAPRPPHPSPSPPLRGGEGRGEGAPPGEEGRGEEALRGGEGRGEGALRGADGRGEGALRGADGRGEAIARGAKAARPSNGAGVPDGADARRAAAEALRARAEELRRTRSETPATPEPAPRADPAPARLDLEDGGLEAILRRAEEAERAHAAEKKARVRQADRATVEAAQRAEAERLAVEKANRARAAEERARAEGRARAAAEEHARAEADARARTEEEARVRGEAERHAAEEEARRASHAEGRARAEADARRQLEEELEQLRTQVQAERRAAEEKIQSVIDRAAAEERASEDLRRIAEEDARRHLEEEAQRRQAEEDELRRAIEGARAEMETLRKKTEAETLRRAEAEAEVERLAREAERRAAEAAALPAPFDFPVYRPPEEDPPPDPAEEAARRRVAMLRERSTSPAAPREDPAPALAPERAPIVRAPPPELKGGTLADLPAPRLFALAARAAVSGRLDFEGEVTRSVWLEDGRVVGASSADPVERVEELALRLGLVTRDQHRQIASAAGPLPSRRAALLLLERGFLKPTELTALVRRRTEAVVFGVFTEAGARFRWAAAEVPPDERTALERSTLALAVEGVRRRWLADRVDAVLGGAGTLLAPVPTGPSAADLALSPEERRAVALADGLRTVDEIVAASPLDPLSTRQALAALVLIGSLAVRVFQGGRSASAATAAIDLARVREKLDQVRRADYFTILGVGRLCTPHEVRDAVDRLRAEFDPRRFQGVREEGLDDRLREILTVVADAREILVDDALRAEYLRGLGE